MVAWSRILVATDFSDPSRLAVRQAVDLARHFDASLILLHVRDRVIAGGLAVHADVDGDHGADRERLLAMLSPAERSELAPEIVICHGSPAAEIVRCAADRDIDVVVMGTHGRGAVGHMLMGSVAERVVRQAPCPVLVVREPRLSVQPGLVAEVIRPATVF